MKINAGTVVRTVGVALVVAAVCQELRKPPAEREWHGKIAGLIPYDFRLPTLERLRDKFWNPDDPRILTEHVFGVGWAVNFYALFERLQGMEKTVSPPSEP